MVKSLTTGTPEFQDFEHNVRTSFGADRPGFGSKLCVVLQCSHGQTI